MALCSRNALQTAKIETGRRIMQLNELVNLYMLALLGLTAIGEYSRVGPYLIVAAVFAFLMISAIQNPLFWLAMGALIIWYIWRALTIEKGKGK